MREVEIKFTFTRGNELIDIQNEELHSLTTATKFLPKRRKGARPNVSTLYRWCQVGVHGIRLEYVNRPIEIAAFLIPPRA